MDDKNFGPAQDFAEATGESVEVSVDSSESALQPKTIDLTQNESSDVEPQEEYEPSYDSDYSPEEAMESSLTTEPTQEDGYYEQEEEEYYSPEEREDEYESDDYDALDVLNEKYGTDYDDLDDLLDDLEEQQENEFASDQIAEMNRFVEETGRSAEDYFLTQSQDYNEMSDQEVIKEYLSLENPDLTDKEIDLFFNDTYKQGEGKYSSEQTELGKIHLKRDVAKARQELQDLQEEYWAPIEDNESYTEEDYIEAQEAREDFLDDVDEELDDMESLQFQMNDSGEVFEYQLTEDDKAMVGNTMANLDDFFEPYQDDYGNWDTEKLALDMIAMKLQDKIVRSVANQYRSQGAESVLRDINNPSYEPYQVSQEQHGESIAGQISKHIFDD